MSNQPPGFCNFKLISQNVGVRAFFFNTDGFAFTEFQQRFGQFESERGDPNDSYKFFAEKEAEITIDFDYQEVRGSGEDVMGRRLMSISATGRLVKQFDILDPSIANYSDSVAYYILQGANIGGNLQHGFNNGFVLELDLWKNAIGWQNEVLTGVFLTESVRITSDQQALEELGFRSLWGAPFVRSI